MVFNKEEHENINKSSTSINNNSERFVVLVVDMDDDIGRKANIKTPVLGRNECIETAIKLGIADPGDSDTNAIFGGIKLHDQLKYEGKNVKIALISGNKNIDSESCAFKIKEQLDFINYLYDPDFIYIVSDGKEDELILNYLKNKDIFVWKKRIVIKQSESLESTYYLIQEFLNKTMSQYVPLIFTVIGFVLLMGALLEGLGWRIIAGLTGLYILLEGSGASKKIKKSVEEGRKKIEFGKLTPIGNILSIIIILFGILYSYNVSNGINNVYSVGLFIYTLIDPVTLALLINIILHFVDELLSAEYSLNKLFKSLLFKILLLFMSRELLIISSEYLRGTSSFFILSGYIIIYLSIVILLSVFLFDVNSKNNNNS